MSTQAHNLVDLHPDERRARHIHGRVYSILITGLITCLILATIVIVVYSLYLFIKMTKLNELAGMHFTKNFSLAIFDMQGKVYSDSAAGVENWLVLGSSEQGFELRFPNDLQFKQENLDLIVLKKYNIKTNANVDSLEAIFYAGKDSIPEEMGLEEYLRGKGINHEATWQKKIVNGSEGIQTARNEQTSTKLPKEGVYWKKGDKVIYLEGVYYNDKNTNAGNLFAKILTEFKVY